MTTDGGATWTPVADLPSASVMAMVQHPANPAWLYVGTAVGLFTSQDGGTTWSASNEGPANVQIRDLNWYSESGNSADLLVATFGRGIWRASLQASGSLSYPLMLSHGWNLLGNSLNQSMPVAAVYGDPAVVTTVWKWDVANAGWQFYAPSMDATALETYTAGKGYGVLSEINPGEGYWVNAKLAASLGTQSGTAFALTSANLQPGWNLVATGNDVSPSVFNLSLSGTPPATGVIPLNLTTLWAWDNPLSQWYFYAPSLEASGGLPGYISGKGYLDFAAGSKTLGKGMGFWVNRP